MVNVTKPSLLLLTLTGIASGIALRGPVTIAICAPQGRFVDVRDHGAVPDDGQSDSVAIASAIASLPARGGAVWFPAGTYTITQQINLGDGDGGVNASTKTGIKLVGEGGGFGEITSVTSVPTKLEWAGPVGGVVVAVNGRISDCTISGFFIEGNGIANAGIRMMAASGCLVENVKIYGYRDVGLAVIGGNAAASPAVVNYNIFNQFSRIHVIGNINGTRGLYMDGNYAALADTWISAFDLCRFEALPGTTGMTGAWLKFVDSITFRRCHFEVGNPTAGPGNTGVLFDALNNHDFPSGIMFYDCSVDKATVADDATHKIRKNFFYGFGTYDGEILPTHGSLLGITDRGTIFGNWGPGPY